VAQWFVHGVLQHTPWAPPASTQMPLWHWSAMLHAAPTLPVVDAQIPLAQLPVVHWSLAVHGPPSVSCGRHGPPPVVAQ
jgi:hypothetical protein